MDEIKDMEIAAEETAQGKIIFASDVIAIIAGLAATEIPGVAGMSGGIAGGIAEMLGRRNLTKGVKVEVGNEEAAVDLYVIIDYGTCIHEVARSMQDNVKKAIESMTGLRVVEVNVHVQGVNIEKEKPVKELPEGGKDDASAPRVR